jgi:hypothetical protein
MSDLSNENQVNQFEQLTQLVTQLALQITNMQNQMKCLTNGGPSGEIGVA